MQMELSDFTAVIGIDWGNKKHDVCVQAMGSDTPLRLDIPTIHCLAACQVRARISPRAIGRVRRTT